MQVIITVNRYLSAGKVDRILDKIKEIVGRNNIFEQQSFVTLVLKDSTKLVDIILDRSFDGYLFEVYTEESDGEEPTIQVYIKEMIIS